MATRHVLKTIAEAWDAVAAGEKLFEVRKNDRFFQAGDTVVLRKLSDDRRTYEPGPSGGFSTWDLEFHIGWLLQGGQLGIEPGYCVFQLKPIPGAPDA